jgi:hypothetical protein
MNFLRMIAAGTGEDWWTRFTKWLLNFDYDKIEKSDIVKFKLLGMPEGWGLLVTVVLVAAMVWLTFFLYRREGKTASMRKKITLAVIRTFIILLALALFFEPTLMVSKLRETLSPVLVLLDTSESMTLDDRYADKGDAKAVADVTGLALEQVHGKPVTREKIVTGILNNSKLDFLNRLARVNPVHVYSIGDKTKRLFIIDLLPPEDEADDDKDGPKPFRHGSFEVEMSQPRTFLGQALNEVLDTAGGQPLAGLIIFSDGQDNHPDLDLTSIAGKNAAREGVAIFGVPIGLAKSRETKNLKVDKSLQCNRTLFVGDPVEFSASVSSSGYANKRVKVELFRQKVGSDKAERVAAEDVVIDANASGQSVALTHTPKEGDEGEYVYTFKLQQFENEQSKRDNVALASGVRVVKTVTNVLLISGGPNWEFRRLRTLLTQDKNVVLSCWLQSATPGYPQLGNRLLRKIPRTEAEFFDEKDGPHVVILIDIDPTDFDVEWFRLLKKFVQERAGGLLYVAGEHRRYSYELFRTSQSSPLRKMLPVELDLGRAQMVVSGGGPDRYRTWPLRPTEDGLNSPLLKFSTNREITERIWQTLPGAVWTFPVKKAKLGSTVLVRTLHPQRSISRDGKKVPMPVLVTSFSGKGRVAFCATDEIWRWRRVGVRIYDTFWTQMVRSLIEGRLMSGQRSMTLETDSESYALGSPVTITAKVFDGAGRGADVPNLTVKIEQSSMQLPGGDEKGKKRDPIRTEAKLVKIMNAEGVYTGKFTPPRTGYYKLWLAGTSGGPGTSTSIEVASQIESDRPEANRVRLAELTDEGAGGGLIELKDLAGLPDRIESRKEQIVEPGDSFSLWANPLALMLIVLLLGIEWTVRKRANMA